MILLKYFVICGLLIIVIFTHDVYAESQPQIQIITCPKDILVGERNSFTFQITNPESSKIIIKNIEVGTDGDFQGNNTDSKVTLDNIYTPLIMEPKNAVILNGNFRTESSGTHYLDINLLYYIDNLDNDGISLTKEICKIKVIPNESSFDVVLTGIVIAGFSAGFAGLVTSLVKQFFIRKNFKFEQKVLAEKLRYEKDVEYEHWQFQKMHLLAEKYYVPLAKFSWDAMQNISISSTSKNNQAIDIAYNAIALFLSKYLDFKKTVGANYLFKDPQFEEGAIGKTQAILTGLPFDEIDIEKIVLNVSQSEKEIKQNPTSGIPYNHFLQWIMSDFCNQSRELVTKKLNEFQRILDQQGERISQPVDHVPRDNAESNPTSTSDVNIWISYLSSKVCQPGQEIFVYGNGFNDTTYSYKFYIEKEVSHEKLNDNMIKISIPTDIVKGTYDLYAKVTKQGRSEFNTIGIPIHVD